jgi:hypothetical protein
MNVQIANTSHSKLPCLYPRSLLHQRLVLPFSPFPSRIPLPSLANFPIPSVLIFIITILLLAADFYYLKNIAGRRLVGLRWWNEVDPQTGSSQWVFESSEPGTKVINATDSRFFWMAMYLHPLLWVALAIVAVVKLEFIWLTLVGESCLLCRRLIGKEQDEMMLITAGCSHCALSLNYEYSRFLSMR